MGRDGIRRKTRMHGQKKRRLTARAHTEFNRSCADAIAVLG